MDKKELIFNIHKNDIIEDSIRYKYDLIQKYGLEKHEIHDIFVRIINYQIEKYGCQIQKYIDDDTSEKRTQRTLKAKIRRQARIKYYKNK